MVSRIVFVSIMSLLKNKDMMLEKTSKFSKSIFLTLSRAFPKPVLEMESNGCLVLIQKYFNCFPF